MKHDKVLTKNNGLFVIVVLIKVYRDLYRLWITNIESWYCNVQHTPLAVDIAVYIFLNSVVHGQIRSLSLNKLINKCFYW